MTPAERCYDFWQQWMAPEIMRIRESAWASLQKDERAKADGFAILVVAEFFYGLHAFIDAGLVDGGVAKRIFGLELMAWAPRLRDPALPVLKQESRVFCVTAVEGLTAAFASIP